MKKLLLYSVLAALVVWFAVTRLYLHWSPYGTVQSIGISLAGAAAALGIIAATGKLLAKQVPTVVYIIVVVITTTAFLLMGASGNPNVRFVKIDCDNHQVQDKKLNRFEKVKFRFLYSGQSEIKVHINFPGTSPLWESGAQVNDIDGTAPGESRRFKVHGSNRDFDFTYTCGTEDPSNGMIQIPRQM